MAKLTKQQKIEKNLLYIRQQYERFLEKHFHYFKKDINVKFFGNKELVKEHIFSKSTFPDDKVFGQVEIDVQYDTVVSGNKKKMLQIAFREAVRYAYWRQNKPYKDNHPEFEEKVNSYGLTDFGGVAQTGMEMHMYGCSKCRKMYILQPKKLPASKDPEQKGFLTVCCKAPFKYFGTKKFSNEKLQQIKNMLGK